MSAPSRVRVPQDSSLATSSSGRSNSPIPPTEPRASGLRHIRPSDPSAMRSPVPPTPTTPVQTAQSPQPPPPPGPAPLPPPHPLPEVPDSLTFESASPTVELDPDSKHAIWEARTKIMANCVEAHRHLATLEEEHQAALQVMQSQFYNQLPDTDKARLQGQLDTLVKQLDDAKQAYEDAKLELFKADSWPAGPTPAEAAMEEDLQQKHAEIAKYIQELNDHAVQMKTILGDLTTFKPPPQPLFLPDSDDEEEFAMDVDNDLATNQGSRKRRRVSKEQDEPSQGRAEGGGGGGDIPTREELDKLLDRLLRIEAEAETLQNDVAEHEQETRDEVEELIATRFEELQAVQAEAQRAQDKKRREEKKERERKVDEVKMEVEAVGSQVEELGDEIGGMLVRVEVLENELVAQRKERQDSFMRVLEVEERLKNHTITQETNHRTVKTLEAAIKAYTSRPPSPPASPATSPSSSSSTSMSPPQYILQALEDPLVDALRATIRPLAEELRRDVERVVREKNEELYRTVWGSVMKTMKVLEMINKRVDAAPSGGGAGVVQAVAAATAAGGQL